MVIWRISLSVCLSVSVYTTVYLSVRLFVSMSVCLSVYTTVYLCVCLSVCLYLCLSVCVCVCVVSLCWCVWWSSAGRLTRWHQLITTDCSLPCRLTQVSRSRNWISRSVGQVIQFCRSIGQLTWVSISTHRKLADPKKLVRKLGKMKSKILDWFCVGVEFLHATAGTAIARLSHRNSVRPSICLSVCHTGGSGKNGAS